MPAALGQRSQVPSSRDEDRPTIEAPLADCLKVALGATPRRREEPAPGQARRVSIMMPPLMAADSLERLIQTGCHTPAATENNTCSALSSLLPVWRTRQPSPAKRKFESGKSHFYVQGLARCGCAHALLGNHVLSLDIAGQHSFPEHAVKPIASFSFAATRMPPGVEATAEGSTI